MHTAPSRANCLPLIVSVSFLLTLAFPPTARAQFGNDDIIISEFFDDILRVNQGSVTDLFDIDRNDNISNLTIADATTAYVSNFREIWRVDTGSNSVTTLVEIDGTSPSEITMGVDGNLLISSASHGVREVNVVTGDISLVYDDSFFNPSDITVADGGTIYVTEFFDGLGRIGPNGGWTKLGDWDTNFFQHIDIGPDGYLYAATTFEDGDIYRINPTSGSGYKIADDVFTFIDDLQVASDGTIYLAGNADTDGDNLVDDLVMAIDPNSGDWTVVVDENMVGDPTPPFFNPMDIEIYAGGQFYKAAVPEPNSALMLFAIGFVAYGRRHRK